MADPRTQHPFASVLDLAERGSMAITPDEGQAMLDSLEGKKQQPGQKNFTTPRHVPNQFSNEDGPFLNPGKPNQPNTPPAAAPAPNPAMAPAPPGPDPTTKDYADMLRMLNADDGHAGALDRYGIPATEGAADGVGHFFSVLPQTLARGFADSVGTTGALAPYANPGSMAATMLVDALTSYYKHGNLSGAVMAPLERLETAPKEVRKLAGQININTDLPSETGDTANSAKWAESLGYPVGAAGPFMPFSGGAAMAMAAGRGVMPIVMAGAKQLATDVGLSVFGGGTGRVLAEEITGGPAGIHNPGEIAGQVGGTLAGAAGLKAGGAIPAAVTAAVTTGLKVLTSSGLLAIERSGTPVVSQIIKSGQYNAQNLMQQMADDPAAAARNAMASGGVQDGTGALPAGFIVPPPTASLDLPVQALMHQVVTKDKMANANYRGVLTSNEALLQGLAPDPSGVDDAAMHLATLQQQRIDAKQTSVKQAIDQADQDLALATRGASLNPEDSERLRRGYETTLRSHLTEAWAESRATTRAEFNAARDAGLNAATIPTTRLYDRLADMMSESITTGMAKSFPQDVVSELYHGRLLKMFDSHGKPVVKLGKDGKPTGSITDNYTLGSTEPWERIQGLYNNVDNAIQNIMGSNSGKVDPVRLQYLMRMQDEIVTTMRDMRLGGKFAPGALPKGLENALRGVQENKEIFINSPVGRVLGFAQGGAGNMPDNAKSIRNWLANTPETTGRVQAMFDAVAARSVAAGINPLDQLMTDMQAMLRQEFANAYRTGGLSSASKWLQNNDAVLSHPSFDTLQKEFRTAANSRDVAEKLGGQVADDVQQIRENRAALFLNGDIEGALSRALSGPNKFTATREFLDQQIKLDPTGRALEGVGNYAFDRMIAKASNYSALNEPGKLFSGKAAEAYYKENQGMFRALDRDIPGYDRRVQQWMEGAKMMDRIQSRPGGIPLNTKEINFSITGMGSILARVMGAKLGASLGTGTIQVPGYGAAFADNVYKQFASRLPADKAQALISRAMVEPDTFAMLMTPIKDQQQANKVSQLMQPYLLSSPAVVKGTYDQYNDPQKPTQEPIPE